MKVLQYNFTPKPDLLLHLGDAFTWSIPLISRALMDMYIGFLGFTNDVIIKPKKTVDISMLDESVLNALDIKKQVAEDVKDDMQITKLEKFIEEQKLKRKDNKLLFQGENKGGLIKVIKNDVEDEIIPEHFDFTKLEDKVNERRPTDA